MDWAQKSHQIPKDAAPPEAVMTATKESETPAGDTLPPAQHPAALKIVREQGWTSLIKSGFAEKLKQHCYLCNRWARDHTALKRHLSQAHPEVWKKCEPRPEPECRQIKNQLERDGACPWCLRRSYSRHYKQCNIVWQSALIGLLDGDADGGRALGSSDARSDKQPAGASAKAPPALQERRPKKPEQHPARASGQAGVDDGGDVTSA